ncbi:hypothetical protein TNCV_1730871 [Trichonephila clavipes]|nr:hypothetical protein TNCV_1730871 [Trichonephila clavipes]
MSITTNNCTLRFKWCISRAYCRTEWIPVVLLVEIRFCLDAREYLMLVRWKTGDTFKQNYACPATSGVPQRAVWNVGILSLSLRLLDFSPIKHSWDFIGRPIWYH